MKEKYADQDDEEREMRLALLGAKQVKDFDIKKVSEKQKFSDVNQPRGMDDSESSDASEGEKELELDQIPTGTDEEEIKIDEDLDTNFLDGAIEERSDENHSDGVLEPEEDTESQAIRQIMKEEDITLVPESSDISEIDKLTGVPSRKDIVQFCMPMLAPYSTIQQFKYKVKLTPGT